MSKRTTAATSGAAALAGALVALALFVGGALAGTPAPTERFTDYRAPTGAELTTAAAAERAVNYALMMENSGSLAQSLRGGSVSVQVAHSTHAAAKAIEEGQAPTVGPTTGSDAEQTELLNSSVYLITLTGNFTIQVPAPRGAALPHGAVLALTLDAHTGFVSGIQLGPNAPDIAALGPVSVYSMGAGLGAAAASSEQLTHKGTLIGNVYVKGKRAAGWRVAVAGGGVRRWKNSNRTGGFSFPLRNGAYSVSAFAPGGHRCATRSVTVLRRHDTYVALRCD